MKDKALSSSLEDYLEAIFQICQQDHVAHANQISEALQVSKSSVSWALKQLSDKGLIEYAPYEPIVLTKEGKILARNVAQRHEQLKGFLVGVLGVDEKDAEANACRMEHVVDKAILKKMRQYMDFLERCPRTGVDWKMGFGYFCQQGKARDKCNACLSDCVEQLEQIEQLAVQRPSAVKCDEPIVDPLPKLSKERDGVILRRLKEVLAESGVPVSKTVEAVADVFMASEGHRTLKEIYKKTLQKNSEVSMAVVEKTMQMLCEHKIAGVMTFKDQMVYEHLHPESHHDHLFCVKCGAIVEFFDPRIELLQAENARRADFRLLTHRLDIHGVCQKCIDRESKIRPLSACLQHEDVEVVRVVADKKAQKHLGDMGLTRGSRLRILNSNCGGGNMIVMVGTGRLMLERSVADKIKVIRTSQEPAFVPGCHGRRRRRHRHQIDRIDP